jgi:sulfofructose kinase
MPSKSSGPFICAGLATLDRVWRVKTLPTGGGKYPAHAYLEVGGGLSATAAVAIARLGEAVAYWGRVGADSAAETILGELRREGVDVAGVRRIAGARSVTAAVLVDDKGERMISADYDPKLDRDAAFLDLTAIADARGVLVDVRWVEGALRVLTEARRLGIPSVLDCEPSAPEVFAALCPLASHVIFSKPGLASFAGTPDIEAGLAQAHARFGDVVGVTLGEGGSLFQSAQATVHIPAPTVAVVDTTGAGDAFHGAYLVAFAETGDMVRAARFATAVAALKCTRLGGRAGLPTRADANAFLKEMLR